MPDSTLVNIGKIGDILKDAADALKKFADSIAHIAKLGDEAWSTVAARRAQSRLMEIYKRTQAYGIGQMIVLSMMHTDVVLDLDIDLITREREWSMLLRSWPMELDHISSLIPDVKALLAELDRERSDFVLQEAYGSLRETLNMRLCIFHAVKESGPPKTMEKVIELQRMFDQWHELHSQLHAANESLRLYLLDAAKRRRQDNSHESN